MINYLFFLNFIGVLSQYNTNTYSFTNTPTLVNSRTISHSNIVKTTFTNPPYPSQEYIIQPYTSSFYEKVLQKKLNYSDLMLRNNSEQDNINIIEKNTENTENTKKINVRQIFFIIHVLNISYIIINLINKFKELYR
jgi:hypothetical protein